MAKKGHDSVVARDAMRYEIVEPLGQMLTAAHCGNVYAILYLLILRL